MRVLHLDTGRTMRGGQWQALMLARSLRAAGVESAFLTAREGLLRGELEREGFETDEASAFHVRLYSKEFDLLHCHDARAHTLCALFARAPFVVSRRVGFPVREGWIHRWKYARAARYLAVSRYVKGELMRAGVPEARIEVVYDAVPLPAVVSSLEGAVIAPASDDPGKGSELVRRTGLDIRLTGDLLGELPRARALVYISSMEGLGSAALLAMSWGVPVVASRVGGLVEAVADGETGLLVENEPANIAAAVARLMEDEELARRLGREGRRRVEERFTLETMAQATMACYRKVLG